MFAQLLSRRKASGTATAAHDPARRRRSLGPPRQGVVNVALVALAHRSVGDSLEREADQFGAEAMSAPPKTAVGGTPGPIQRFSTQHAGRAVAMPAGVEQVLAGPKRPLEPALRQDMEHRFGHDFSRVRIHVGTGR